MKFKIKNAPNFNKAIFKIKNENKTELINDKEIFFKLPLQEIINKLNDNKLLNIESKEEVNIIFENFNWFGKIQTTIRNLINRVKNEEILEKSIAHYDAQTKSIHIFNGVIEPKTNNEIFKESYSKLINLVSDPNFIINFFVLHEIGHAIHDVVIQKKDYGNLTDYFKIGIGIGNNIHNQQNTILHENFADMFASIAYLNIDKNNQDLITDLELFNQFRKEIKEEKYYTFNNLDVIIKDYKSNNVNFTKNSQILEYININTNNEIKLRLKESLERVLSSQEHNMQLNYLSNLLEVKDKSFNGIIYYLNKEVGYVKPVSVIYEEEYYNPDYKKSEMNKITQRIKRFTENIEVTMYDKGNKNKI